MTKNKKASKFSNSGVKKQTIFEIQQTSYSQNFTLKQKTCK